jgi:hypothetical protein
VHAGCQGGARRKKRKVGVRSRGVRFFAKNWSWKGGGINGRMRENCSGRRKFFSINPSCINVYGVNRGKIPVEDFSWKTTFAGRDSSCARP